MNVYCSTNPCPILLNAACVFYQGANLIYTGINTNDNLQIALEKIDARFSSVIGTLNVTSPLQKTGTVNVVLSIPQATSLVDGYLDSADWSVFNSKQNAITLTTTGSSGASTFISSTLNIPNYSLSGLGGNLQAVTDIGSATTNVITAAGFTLPAQPIGLSTYRIGQVMATDDSWAIYGYADTVDNGDLFFELQDNAALINGQRFRFRYGNISSGTPKDILLMTYDGATIDGTLQVNNLAGIGTRMVVANSVGLLSTAAYPTSVNIYNSDGTLTGNREVSLGGNYLQYGGASVDLRAKSTSATGASTMTFYSNTWPYGLKIGMYSNTFGSGMNDKASIHMMQKDLYFTQSGSAQPSSADITMAMFQGTKNVSIGSVSDAGYKLDVNGTARVTLPLQVDSRSIKTANSVAGYYFQGSALWLGSFPCDVTTGSPSVYDQYTNKVIIGNTSWGTNVNNNIISIGMSQAGSITTYGGILIGNTSALHNAGYRHDLNIVIGHGSGMGFTGLFNTGKNIVIGNSSQTTSSPNANKLTIIGNDISSDLANAVILGETTQSVMIGSYSGLSASAKVQIDSITKGFLPPRMTTTQKNAISTPVAGLMVYDNTTNVPNYYNGAVWVGLGTGTVTSIATTGPITGGTITTSGTIGITQSSASSDGYLSSTDWSIFNSKIGGTGSVGQVAYWNGTSTQTGSNNLFWDSANNRLGIGTATPTAPLDFGSGTGSAGDISKIALYASPYGNYGFGVSPNQLDYVSANSHVFYNNSPSLTELFRIDSVGNITSLSLVGTGTRMVVASSTGVLSTQAIPAGTVTSIATSGPITGGTITSSGTIGITQATTSTDGYLSSTNWNTFNDKQPQLNGTGFVKASGTTISYDNSTYYLASNPSGFLNYNIYTSDGTLAGDRYIDANNNNLWINNVDTLRVSIGALGSTNVAALFEGVEPNITIKALGASNSASLFLSPSTGYNGAIHNRTGGGLEFYTGATPDVAMTIGANLNVGIGGAPNAINSLEVNRPNQWSGAFIGNMGGNRSPSATYGIHLGFNYTGGSGESNIVWGNAPGGGSPLPYLVFSTWNGVTKTDRVEFQDTGNVVFKQYTSVLSFPGTIGALVGYLGFDSNGNILTVASPTGSGTVTSVATSGPITGGTITTSGTIGITQSGIATDGYLSSTDWNTFNNKVPTARTLTINGVGYDLSADRSWTIPSISDGDKGDITVSGSGSVWTIDNAVVGIAKLSATGTPSSSTFLRGDNTWATIGGGTVVSNSYTPTLTNIFNCTSLTLEQATYTRVDNIVTVSVGVSLTVSSLTAKTEFYISLPISTSVAIQYYCGTGTFCDAGSVTSAVLVNITDVNRAGTTCKATSTSASSMNVVFQYTL